MKVIDLYNKIANGEEIPKKIKYNGTYYTLYVDEDTNDKYYQDDACKYFFLTMKCLTDLNNEVEILEEEKKIEYIDLSERIGETWCISPKEEKIQNKINEIIDYLESKGE